jgi:hypothetical protein
MTETVTIRNGINVDQLLATIEAVKDDPAVGMFTFRASSRWQDGTYNVGEIGRFIHRSGRPVSGPGVPARGRRATGPAGQQQGPERGRVAAAGAGVLLRRRLRGQRRGTGHRAHRDGIHEGDLDVRSFLGLDGSRAGFTEIRAKARVSSPNASKEQLVELCQYVQDTSPVRDSLANPIPVTTALEVR